jgi:hypothetical protein
MEIHVNLHQSKNPEGWSASIATARVVGDKKISMGESMLYPNKEAAWKSIQREAQNLDYENDEVLFNQKAVNDYNDLVSKVSEL